MFNMGPGGSNPGGPGAIMSGSIAARETAATGSAAFKWQPLRMMVAATNDMCAGKGVVRVIAWHFVILRQVACMSARLRKRSHSNMRVTIVHAAGR